MGTTSPAITSIARWCVDPINAHGGTGWSVRIDCGIILASLIRSRKVPEAGEITAVLRPCLLNLPVFTVLLGMSLYPTCSC